MTLCAALTAGSLILVLVMNVINPPFFGQQGFSLRPIEVLDIPDWYEYLRSPEMMAYQGWQVCSAADLAPMIQACRSEAPDAPLRLAIVDDELGRLAGTIGLGAVSQRNRSAELDFDLAPAYRGRGLAAAACRAVAGWALSTCGLFRLQAVAWDGNPRAQQVLRACGFQQEGLLRAYRQLGDKPGDFLMFSRLASDPAPDAKQS